jgi:hypothetical protein
MTAGTSKKERLLYPKIKLLKKAKHTAAGIRWWSPTQLLIRRFEAYL